MDMADATFGEAKDNGVAQMTTRWRKVDNELVILATVIFNAVDVDAMSFFNFPLELDPAVNTTKTMPYAESDRSVPPVLLET